MSDLLGIDVVQHMRQAKALEHEVPARLQQLPYYPVWLRQIPLQQQDSPSALQGCTFIKQLPDFHLHLLRLSYLGLTLASTWYMLSVPYGVGCKMLGGHSACNAEKGRLEFMLFVYLWQVAAIENPQQLFLAVIAKAEVTFPCEYAREEPATPAPTTTKSHTCASTLYCDTCKCNPCLASPRRMRAYNSMNRTDINGHTRVQR